MTRLFSIEASPEADKRSLLLSVITVLCEHRLTPELLLWSSLEGRNEAKLWLMVNDEAVVMDAFAERCRDMAGVLYFAQHSPGEDPPVLELQAHLASAGLCVSRKDIRRFCTRHGIRRSTSGRPVAHPSHGQSGLKIAQRTERAANVEDFIDIENSLAGMPLSDGEKAAALLIYFEVVLEPFGGSDLERLRREILAKRDATMAGAIMFEVIERRLTKLKGTAAP